VYETPPWGYTDQPAFLNMVSEAETALEPLALLDRLKALEEKIGRQSSVRFGPRLIDLDILFYADQVVQSDRLEIPHPRLAERAFVLVPLADLAPNLIHPVSRQTISTLLARVDQGGIIRVTTKDDHPPAEVCEYLQSHIPGLQLFQRLPPSHQREWLSYVLEARKPATRQRRLEKMAAQLGGEGKSS
jgi:2-amino-4-hydroxy-6-hydroxymethyldihydropteridine diphosphokinase